MPSTKQKRPHNPKPENPLTRFLQTAGKLFLAAAAPAACRHCGKTLVGHRNPHLCADCLANLRWIGPGACRGCGYPAGPHAELGKNCRHCRNRDLSLTSAAAVVRYAGAAQSLVKALKFRGETELAEPMGQLMVLRAREFSLPKTDLVVPIPLHPARKRARGFNQAELLASIIAKQLSTPLDANILKKTRYTMPQSLLTRHERMNNAKNSYQTHADLAAKTILLVDDVVTTGATIAECAKTLRQAGASRIHALSFAR